MAYPDITVTIEPGNGGAYSEFLKTKDSVGEFPDVMEMRDTAVYVRAGKLEPLPDDIVNLFKTTTAFAGKVKEAVADRDMDALASLASYPVYVGFKDGGVSAGSPEELAALGTDRIFTPELAAAVEAAGDETLSPSMAGFVLKKDGTPNIVFGVSEGVLAVKGINY